jgi:hypothetical protein
LTAKWSSPNNIAAVRTKLARSLIAFSLIIAVGGHWAVLQSVAWFGMMVSYSEDAPLSIALEKTFDGKHPCNLCMLVQEGKKAEKKQDLLEIRTRLDFWFAQAPSLINPPPLLFVLPAGPDSARVRAEAPPTPPPRLT